jgi:hypothetical protein
MEFTVLPGHHSSSKYLLFNALLKAAKPFIQVHAENTSSISTYFHEKPLFSA